MISLVVLTTGCSSEDDPPDKTEEELREEIRAEMEAELEAEDTEDQDNPQIQPEKETPAEGPLSQFQSEIIRGQQLTYKDYTTVIIPYYPDDAKNKDLLRTQEFRHDNMDDFTPPVVSVAFLGQTQDVKIAYVTLDIGSEPPLEEIIVDDWQLGDLENTLLNIHLALPSDRCKYILTGQVQVDEGNYIPFGFIVDLNNSGRDMIVTVDEHSKKQDFQYATFENLRRMEETDEVFALKDLVEGTQVGSFIVDSSEFTDEGYYVVFTGIAEITAEVSEDLSIPVPSFTRLDDQAVMIDFGDGVIKDILQFGYFANDYHPEYDNEATFIINGFSLQGNYYYYETVVYYSEE